MSNTYLLQGVMQSVQSTVTTSTVVARTCQHAPLRTMQDACKSPCTLASHCCQCHNPRSGTAIAACRRPPTNSALSPAARLSAWRKECEPCNHLRPTPPLVTTRSTSARTAPSQQRFHHTWNHPSLTPPVVIAEKENTQLLMCFKTSLIK